MVNAFRVSYDGYHDNIRMNSIDRFLLRRFLPRLLARASDETIHRSGPEGAKTNCFTTTVMNGKEPYLMLQTIDDFNIKGLQYDGNRFAIPQSIEIADVDPKSIEVTHYYGLDSVCYRGIRDVAIGLLTNWPYAKIHVHRMGEVIAQRLFNRRQLVARRRLDILREVVSAIDNGADAVGALELMSLRHGYRWAGHPHFQAHQRSLELHLEWLAESGELVKVNYGYRPTGLALKMLEENWEQDRKHRENLRVQGILAVLTLVSAMMAATQAGLIRLPTLIDFADAARATTQNANLAQRTLTPKRQ